MVKKIALVDYECGVDDLLIPLGHTKKVLQEYSCILHRDYDVHIFASKHMLQHINNGFKKEKFFELPKENIISTSRRSIIKKIRFRINCWKNLNKIFAQKNCDTLWFVNVTYMLFVYLFFRGKGNKKIICTMYREDFLDDKWGYIFNLFYKKIIPKVDIVIKSCSKFNIQNSNTIFMPDYYYSDKYLDFRAQNKQNMVVILGTIDKRKEIHKLVEILNTLKYRVVIAGRFIDKEYKSFLKKALNQNIQIIDKQLSYEEYYFYLGKAKFCLLPYNMQTYGKRTSGVMIESIFLDTIPIADDKLLNDNGIKGISLNEFLRLGDKVLNDCECEMFYKKYKQYREKTYDFDLFKHKLNEKISRLYI